MSNEFYTSDDEVIEGEIEAGKLYTEAEFIDFVLNKYIEVGVEELDQDKLPILLKNKYHSIEDAKGILGNLEDISHLFIAFQEHLYAQKAA
jgi:type I restriction enzyme R subunit